MATLWDREMAGEIPRVARLAPDARLRLIEQLLSWTVEALPRGLLDDAARGVVDAALRTVRDAAAGSPPDDPDELEDRLDELAEDDDLQDLSQLFVALNDSVGVPAEDVTAEFTLAIMSACYDAVRDCAGLPEFPVGTPERTVLDAERANAAGMAAIERQRFLIRAAGNGQDRAS